MKLEVGMYVRFKRGFELANHTTRIAMLIENQNNSEFWKLDIKEVILEEDVIKASHNIIDLIEIGDYVNGVEVEEITDNEIMLVDTHLYIDKSVANDFIETILTKEQFENNCYKIGDE